MKCRFSISLFGILTLTFSSSSYSADSSDVPLHLCADAKHGYRCATIGLQRPIGEDELLESNCLDDFVVFHYGRNMKNMGAWAARATKAGVPSLAIPSLISNEKTTVFINGVKLRNAFGQTAFEQLIPNYIELKLRGRLHGDIANCTLTQTAQ